MLLLFSSEPTKATYVNDYVTKHLFGYLYQKEREKGRLKLPEALCHFTTKAASELTWSCKDSIIMFSKDAIANSEIEESKGEAVLIKNNEPVQ